MGFEFADAGSVACFGAAQGSRKLRSAAHISEPYGVRGLIGINGIASGLSGSVLSPVPNREGPWAPSTWLGKAIETGASPVATLGHMMRQPRDHDARQASHSEDDSTFSGE